MGQAIEQEVIAFDQPCPVDDKGYCPRHKTVHKGRRLELSQDMTALGIKYRRGWDQQVGQVNQYVGEKNAGWENERRTEHGLGDLLEKALSLTGITKTRVEKFLGRPCGCKERQAKLNALGFWVRRVAVGGVLEGAVKFFNNMVGSDGIEPEREPGMRHRWTYGIMTTAERRTTTLPQTIASLKAAGFDKPRLFVDGSKDIEGYEKEFGLPVTVRTPHLFVAGNWILSIYELFIRDPEAERFCLFQDDMIASKNLLNYLDQCQYEESPGNDNIIRGVYWNLYTVERNEQIIPINGDGKRKIGWHQAQMQRGGLGAVGLCFSRQALITLIGSKHMAERPCDKEWGRTKVDGGIWQAMTNAGWKEYVHFPSLVQHIGMKSSKQYVDYTRVKDAHNTWTESKCFWGEGFDLLSLSGKSAAAAAQA